VLICENNDKKNDERKGLEVMWWLVMVKDRERGSETKLREDL